MDRISEVGEDLLEVIYSNPQLRAGPALKSDQVAQGLVQSSSENLWFVLLFQ